MELQFLGATREVTGSCHLVRTQNQMILVDCGLYQGGPDSEARNFEPFPFDPKNIDAVVLTHAHIDHSGRLPLLVQRGFSGPIYTHQAGKELTRILLKDSAFLAEKDAEWENRKRERQHRPPISPLYTSADVIPTLQQMHGMQYGEVREILPGIRLCFQDAGHILGASEVELWLSESGATRKLVFSGDLGHRLSPISPPPSPIQEADLVVMEATYGDRNHRDWTSTWQELDDIFTQGNDRRGNVLIPAFAVGRTQQLLYLFAHKHREWQLQRWLLALDSPMAIETTRLYSRYAALLSPPGHTLTGQDFNPPGLRLCQTTMQSMKLNRLTGGAIIIAGSGMCNGGRIRHHLKHNVWRRDCQVVIVGYQAKGTLGHALVSGAKQITLWGETVKVAARIHTVGGLSAHADQSGLLAWYGNFKTQPHLALVHGEEEPLRILADTLADHARTVSRPRYGDRLDLVKWRWKNAPSRV